MTIDTRTALTRHDTTNDLQMTIKCDNKGEMTRVKRVEIEIETV